MHTIGWWLRLQRIATDHSLRAQTASRHWRTRPIPPLTQLSSNSAPRSIRGVSERALLPGEFAVLGLLALRPMHGYEMARYFDRDDLTEVCPIDQSLLYTYVRNIEGRGLVAYKDERVGLRPPRKTYRLTESGRLVVQMWLRQPVERMREIRLAFLLKLYFLQRLDSGAERDLLRRQIDVCLAYRERCAERVERLDGFGRLVAQSKLSAAESSLAWLQAYSSELDGIAGESRSSVGAGM